MPMLARADREHCLTLNLDTKHQLVATTTVSIGSIDHTFMSPREIYRDALLHNAAAVILAHNHPSGDPEPSRDDELITARLARAGDLLGVSTLDHIVIGHGRWVSLAHRGLLDQHQFDRDNTSRRPAPPTSRAR
jgi:DNA repair protein RadC